MQFFKALCAAAAIAVAQAVIITNTAASFEGVTAGSALSISWANATGPVTLILKNGPANALVTVSTIASGLTTSPYAWSIPSTLPTDYYALEIQDSAGINYSEEFQITGGPSATSSGVSSTATMGSSTMASSASMLSSSMTTTAASSTSTTTSGSAGSNSNSTSASSSGSSPHASTTTSTSAHGSSTATPASTSSLSSAAGVASPLAFVFLAFAAILTLN